MAFFGEDIHLLGESPTVIPILYVYYTYTKTLIYVDVVPYSVGEPSKKTQMEIYEWPSDVWKPRVYVSYIRYRESPFVIYGNNISRYIRLVPRFRGYTGKIGFHSCDFNGPQEHICHVYITRT